MYYNTYTINTQAYIWKNSIIVSVIRNKFSGSAGQETKL